MILTGLTTGEICAVIGTTITILTVIVVPYLRRFKRKIGEDDKRGEIIDSIPDRFKVVESQIQILDKKHLEIKEKLSQTMAEQKEFEIQELKANINDIYFSFDSIDRIPDELLLDMASYCDSYIERGGNHNTGAKCSLAYEEIKRRVGSKKKNEV